MPFTDQETASHLATLEEHFWAHRRPPLHVRDQLSEGQRIEGLSIELFFNRTLLNREGKVIEEAIAKLKFIRSKDLWQILWKRADGKWHSYPPFPEAPSLSEALAIVHADPNGCFFG
jgi:hypothetical protein